MSGAFIPEDKGWLNYMVLGKHLSKTNEAILSSMFDAQTDQDVEDISANMKKEAYLRKVCLYKQLIFPVEWLFTRVMFGKETAKDKYKLYKLFAAYYDKKIDFDTLNKELTKVMSNGKLI